MLEISAAVVTLLRADTTLAGMVTAIGMGKVPDGTQPPYVLVHEVDDSVSYAFGNSEVYTDNVGQVELYSVDGTVSAQTQAASILKRIKTVLHNQAFNVADNVLLRSTRGGAIPSAWEQVTEVESYFKAGHTWWFCTRPA